MSIEDDVVLLDRVPTFHLLGNAAIRVLAIGSEQQEFASGSVLFRAGDASDCGYVVQRGSFHLGFPGGSKDDIVAGPGALIGELALIVPMTRPATATAREYASVIRITRTLFQRVLDSEPDGARRLRDEFAHRTSQAASDLLLIGGRLTS
ncbi:MAG: cyclic nucleotide-binding domain-containing protein [Xanthobacteraceae bacterium]|jgi:CRP-like cAMP-binding protein|nr:cyclic nucleotide-binding domain-containing protein [Hyphomicrobiales bacterium]